MTKAAKSVDTVRGSYTLIKNKHTNKIVSNIQHQKSNFKHLTFNSAITLIALIITIIVLLILAGVTLTMLMGENGIIKKAQLAKEKTNEAQIEEEKNLKSLEDKINNYNSRENGVSESKYIKEFKPIILSETNVNIKVSNSLENGEDSEVYGYLFLLDGKVVSMQQNKEYVYLDLNKGQEYEISIIAVDKQGNFKKSSTIKHKVEKIKARYIVVDVYDHIDGNSAAVNELEFYNSKDKINYTILNVYDSASKGKPSYDYDSRNIWKTEFLHDGKIEYSSNSEGSKTTSLYFFSTTSDGTSPNTGYWARILVDLGSVQELENIRIAIGNSEKRIPKDISMYVLNEYVDGTEENSSYEKYISNRNSDGLLLINKKTFENIITEPTWFEIK